jgi:ParB family chromosome partitioning protein
MPTAKRALGRGLAELIPVGGDERADPSSGPKGQDEVPVSALHPNPQQPRTHFEDATLAELATSIQANGILQPILVRPRSGGGYEIVAGERRYRAALRAGLARVPVVVRDLGDEEALALALVENLLREDIGPLETARAFRRLMEDFGWTQAQMSERVGKSRSAVTNTLRLLHLPPPIQESLGRGEITEGHARALLTGEGAERQREVWEMILRRNLSVRDTEHLMKATPPSPPAARAPRLPADASADLASVQDRMRRALGTKVQILGGEQRGRIVIDFYSAEELDALLSRFEGDQDAGSSRAAALSGAGRSSGPGSKPIRS